MPWYHVYILSELKTWQILIWNFQYHESKSKMSTDWMYWFDGNKWVLYAICALKFVGWHTSNTNSLTHWPLGDSPIILNYPGSNFQTHIKDRYFEYYDDAIILWNCPQANAQDLTHGWSTLFQVPSGNRPLSESMLTHIQYSITRPQWVNCCVIYWSYRVSSVSISEKQMTWLWWGKTLRYFQVIALLTSTILKARSSSEGTPGNTNTFFTLTTGYLLFWPVLGSMPYCNSVERGT